MTKRWIHVIGLMSGSSLDGLDLCYVRFEGTETFEYNYEILNACTYPFSDVWRSRLAHLHQQNAEIYARTHVYFGHYLGELVNRFRKEFDVQKIDFIASHGHTVFHDPSKSYTAQIGDGASLATITGLPVVCDFRSSDVAIGGEGAPLAPIVERFLYPQFDMFLNLGGIANITCIHNDIIVAQDICAANQLLNFVASKEGMSYDKDGALARKGVVNDTLLDQLNQWDYFFDEQKRSIGNEMIRQDLLPLLSDTSIINTDMMATVVEHVALQIAAQIRSYIPLFANSDKVLSLLCTGGGAHNGFLCDVLKNYLNKISEKEIQMVIPDSETIDHKESLLISFLGLRRWELNWNSLASVTGAEKNTINGCIYYS